MNQRPDSLGELITGLVAMIVTIGAFDTFQQDLEPVAGYPASVVGGIVISAIIVFVVCLFGKMPRPKAITTAVLLPPTLATFEQIRKHTVDLTGSGMLSLVLAVVFAVLIGAAVAALVSRLTGVEWNSDESSIPSETQQSAEQSGERERE